MCVGDKWEFVLDIERKYISNYDPISNITTRTYVLPPEEARATMVEIQIADELGGEPKRDSYWDSLGGVLVSSPTYSYKNIK